MMKNRIALLWIFVLLVLPQTALAAWGENWGEMVWGVPVSVPTLPGVGLILLAIGLSAAAAWVLHKRRVALGLPVLLVLLAVPLVVVAGTVSVPNTFVNGDIADADEVNANFDAIETAVNDNDSRLSEVEADTSANTYDVGVNAAAIVAEETRASNAEATNAASISGETNARIAADAAHDTAIAANTSAISAESTARIAGDSSLDTRLDAVESGNFPGGLQLDTQLVLDDEAIGSPVSIAAGSGAMVIQNSNFTNELRLGRGFNGSAIQAGTTIGTTSNLLLNPHGGDVDLGDFSSEVTVGGQALVEGDLEVAGRIVTGKMHVNSMSGVSVGASDTSHGLVTINNNFGTPWADIMELYSGTGDVVLMAKNNGNVGLGDGAPDARLHITEGTANAHLRIENSASSNYWDLRMTTNSWLRVHYNNAEVGYFSPSTGAYTATSDERLKKNIEPISGNVLEGIMRLNPVKYHFVRNEDESLKQTWGFMAQEVMKEFPAFVDGGDEESEYYGMNYDNFGILSIKGIQEQQVQIEALKKENQELKEKFKAQQAQLGELLGLIRDT